VEEIFREADLHGGVVRGLTLVSAHPLALG
jgi:hypothetical protein